MLDLTHSSLLQRRIRWEKESKNKVLCLINWSNYYIYSYISWVLKTKFLANKKRQNWIIHNNITVYQNYFLFLFLAFTSELILCTHLKTISDCSTFFFVLLFVFFVVFFFIPSLSLSHSFTTLSAASRILRVGLAQLVLNLELSF